MDAPASKPREDPPASGASPDGQVPGKLDSDQCWLGGPGHCFHCDSDRAVVEDSVVEFVKSGGLAEMIRADFGKSEPIPADDEQVEVRA